MDEQQKIRGCTLSVPELVEAEADCCGWASWALADEGDHVVLEVTAPPQEVAGLARLFGL